MSLAYNMLVVRIMEKKEGPSADFDVLYFMQLVRDLANEPETLERILAGRGDECVVLDHE